MSRAIGSYISIMEELELGIGDTIAVYKANMIIPQIAENLTRSGVKDIPEGMSGLSMVRQRSEKSVMQRCSTVRTKSAGAKHLKLFALFVSRDALNIDGLSEATL